MLMFYLLYFSMLANLLQCDVMLLIMQTVLKRAVDLKARCFSESHLQKVRWKNSFKLLYEIYQHFDSFRVYLYRLYNI